MEKAQGQKPCAFSLPCRDKARNTVYKNVYRVQSLSVLVRVIGFEPIWDRSREILSLLRLPISPYSHIYTWIFNCYAMQRLRLFVCRFRHTGAFLWDFCHAACGGLHGALPRRRRFFCAPLLIFFPCAADLFSVRRLFAEDRASVGVHSLPHRRCASLGAAGERKRPPLHAKRRPIFWRRHPDLNRGVRALQALALPLGYSAKNKVRNRLERETRFELATFTLAR